MTEEEAKTKWCPFARLASLKHGQVGNVGIEDDKSLTPLSSCIASACMAWRWGWRDQEKLVGNNGRFRRGFGEENGFEVEGPIPDDGFCGLAGQP